MKLARRRSRKLLTQPSSGRINHDHPVVIFDNASISSAASIRLLTIKDVALLLRISSTSVRRLQLARRLPFFKVGGSIRFLESDIAEYLGKGRVDAIDQ
jgi:excisionase family DNA binding protein